MFLIRFLPVCKYYNRKNNALSSQGHKQKEASLSGSKKAVLGEKNQALLCTLLKI
jgi:hypothetical protein